MKQTTNKSAVVVGAGIGGLAAAMALAQQGIDVCVLEQAEAIGEIGAGLQIGPNAFAALEALGIADAVKRSAVMTDRMVMMDAVTAETVATVPLREAFRERFGNPYAVAHRADLHAALYEACLASARIQVHVNSRVQRLSIDDGRCRVHTVAGRVYEAAALIGADGTRSVVRDVIVGDQPRVSGHVVYRAVIPADEMPQELQWNAPVIWAGPNCHLVHYPIRGGDQYNLVVTFHSRQQEVWAVTDGSRDEVMSYFRDIQPLPRRLLELPKTWRRWSTADRDPVSSWSRGNATLLGDAAHPMMQYLAQGACMALEDAVTLGYAAKSATTGTDIDWQGAWRIYERARIARTARVVLSVREFGRLCHVGGVERLVRNALWRGRTPERFYDALEWLYAWRPEHCISSTI